MLAPRAPRRHAADVVRRPAVGGGGLSPVVDAAIGVDTAQRAVRVEVLPVGGREELERLAAAQQACEVRVRVRIQVRVKVGVARLGSGLGLGLGLGSGLGSGSGLGLG